MSESKRLFGAEDLEEALLEDVAEYPLPDDPGCWVRVRSSSAARLKQYQLAQAKGGTIARRAEADLVAESVIDANGNPVFTAADLFEKLGRMRSRRFAGIVRIISRHNGGEDQIEGESDAEKK